MSGIFLYFFLCLIELLGAHIACKVNPNPEKEYYNENDPFRTFFL
jgi:hypothetical protein